ncbi:hypothetical protein SLS63_013117 [Diaporthe eres]|uniref:AAA+ ATPase domain-containing protein n=1 Tax=Diaporthe eres TaxID=83184 RepID=A0ABR1NPH7_DIAER
MSSIAQDQNKSSQEHTQNVLADDKAANSDDDSDHTEASSPDSKTDLAQWTSKFTKYITALEDRIKELESRADIGVETGSKKSRRNRTSTEIVQFFLASDESTLDGGATKDNRWKIKGTFSSEVDDNPLIRVLYRRTGADPDGSHEPEQQNPSPGEVDILEIRIHSKSIAGFVDDKLEFDFSKNGLLHFTKPFRPLIRMFASIKERLKELEATHGTVSSSLQDYHDFRNLVNFIDNYFGAKLALYDDYHSTDSAATNYTTTAGILPQAYKVLRTLGGIPLKKSLAVGSGSADIQTSTGSQRAAVGGGKYKLSPLLVFCYYLDFNGSQIIDIEDAFRFPPFDGEKDVTSLDGYPLRYKPKSTQIRDDLDARGRAFIDLMVVRHKKYDGLAATEKKEEVKSDVIVDMNLAMTGQPWVSAWPGTKLIQASWFTKVAKEVMEVPKRTCNHTSCHDPSCIEDVYVQQQKQTFVEVWPELDAKMEEHDLLKINTEEHIDRCKKVMERENLLVLFPGIVSGYSLRNRKWVRLDINQLQDVTYQDGWSELVLPKGHKKMVQAMVETFAKRSRLKTTRADTETSAEDIDRFGFDLVQQKGQGCIILLHGAPGVGKTSTAECVAAYTRRPLFPITSGDIGFSPEDIENRLEENFNLAHNWGCVLLLDKADVFLAKRNKEDIKRNGLVSVFLRVLEYYSGILILTTNRVGAFDEAFHSRIHLSLFYPSLDLKKSLKIFKTNFRRIDKHNEDRVKRHDAPMEIQDKKIRRYWEKNHEVLKWNGRQIRNAFQTAMALADCEARERDMSPVITVEHFETIANASVDFAKYMARVQGGEADHIAQLDRTRLGQNPEIKRELNRLESDSEFSDSDHSGSENNSTDSSDEEGRKSRRKSKKKAKDRDVNKDKNKREGKGKKKSKTSKGRSRKSGESEGESE